MALTIMGRIQIGRDLPKEEVDLIVQFLGTLTDELGGVPLDRPGRHLSP